MGAIYLTVKVDYIGKTTADGKVLANSTDVNFYLIKEAGVALVPFSAFGTGDDSAWFRVSVGASTLQEMRDLLPRRENSAGEVEINLRDTTYGKPVSI
jgi:aspartate aminotransferase